MEEAFVFLAKPRCSSSREHHSGNVVLVISGVPFLQKPLVSSPITLRSRLRKSTNKAKKLKCDFVSSRYSPPQITQDKTNNSQQSSDQFQSMIVAASYSSIASLQVVMDSKIAQSSTAFPANVVAVNNPFVLRDKKSTMVANFLFIFFQDQSYMQCFYGLQRKRLLKSFQKQFAQLYLAIQKSLVSLRKEMQFNQNRHNFSYCGCLQFF